MLDPRRPVVLVGSCFSEAIGAKMRDALWPVTVNPCGVLYNPLSIGQSIINAMLPADECRKAIDEAIVERDGIFLSWLFDSSVAATSRTEYIDRAMEAYRVFREALLNSQALISTLGTAYVYRLADSDRIVANCHKFPAATFRRQLLTVEQISEWSELVSEAMANRLDALRLIQTVSPVRHLSDGFHGNAISKATLLLACRQLDEGRFHLEYFPAFEILNDDLRDYRFYASDLCHPSPEAVDYIWQIFKQTFLDEEGRRIVERGEQISARQRHRAIIPGSKADISFRRKTEEMLREFQKA